MKSISIGLSFLIAVFFPLQGCWAAESAPNEQSEKQANEPKVDSSTNAPDGDAAAPASEAEKAEMISRILSKHSLEVWKGNLSEERYAFCKQFYQDLKNASPKIEYIEPVVKTDDKNHPELKKYRTACKDREGLPNDPSTFWGLWVVGDHSFRLYRGDFDKNSENGEEEILYGRVHPEKKTSNWKGGYAVIDFGGCVVETGYPIHVTYVENARGQWESLNNFDALINYQENYFAFEVYDQKYLTPDSSSRYRIDIYRFTDDVGFKRRCSMQW